MSFYKLSKLKYPWKKYVSTNKDTILYISGNNKKSNIDYLLSIGNNYKKIKNWVSNAQTHFGFIIINKESIYIAADRIASFPIYLCNFDQNIIGISSFSSYWINSKFNLDIDYENVFLYQMAGYTFGRTTLRKSVMRVLPGELCSIRKNKFSYDIDFDRYYKFCPNFKTSKNFNFLSSYLDFDKAINKSIKKLIEQADGRKIVLALSSGYDSRLILGKLIENNYLNVECFSYGNINSFEVKEAKNISENLNIKWHHVDDDFSKNKQKMLLKGKLKEYFNFASGLSSTAAMTEIIYLDKLIKRNPYLKDALFTNGQTGDFISGGHLFYLKNQKSKKEFMKNFINKHLNLIIDDTYSLKQKSIFLKKFLVTYPTKQSLYHNYHSLTSLIEWQERQSNYIINQQRAYDYLNLEWSLPLWDCAVMDFFEKLPLNWSINQKFYKKYLKKWNHKDIFSNFRTGPQPWFKFKLLILITGQIIKYIFGVNKKNDFYKLMDYFSVNNYQYNYFSFSKYKMNYNKIRNAVTLFSNYHYKNLRDAIKNLPKPIF